MGRCSRIAFIVFENPKSKMRSASSNTRTCRRYDMAITHYQLPFFLFSLFSLFSLPLSSLSLLLSHSPTAWMGQVRHFGRGVEAVFQVWPPTHTWMRSVHAPPERSCRQSLSPQKEANVLAPPEERERKREREKERKRMREIKRDRDERRRRRRGGKILFAKFRMFAAPTHEWEK